MYYALCLYFATFAKSVFCVRFLTTICNLRTIKNCILRNNFSNYLYFASFSKVQKLYFASFFKDKIVFCEDCIWRKLQNIVKNPTQNTDFVYYMKISQLLKSSVLLYHMRETEILNMIGPDPCASIFSCPADFTIIPMFISVCFFLHFHWNSSKLKDHEIWGEWLWELCRFGYIWNAFFS